MDEEKKEQETISSKPESCKVCPLYNSTEGIVWGQGPTNAKLFFCGEAPGEEEGISLTPFSGGAGRTLNAQLAHAGISRSEVFISNVVKCRPTARGAMGRIVNRLPTETEILCCAKFLLGEIEQVQPNVIVALGNTALHTLTGMKKGITKLRSVPIEGPRRKDGLADKYKVVPTYHPARIMRQSDLWPAAIFDLVRARTESASPRIVRREWKRVIHARLSDVGESLERRIRAIGRYRHDLETTGLDPHKDTVRCIGISAEPEEVYCFDWTGDVIAWVAKLHSDPTLTTVGQNSEVFDIWFQEEKNFVFNGPSYDAMLGHHLLNASLPKDLGFIGATVTDEPYWKDESMYRSGEDALQVGCCKDVYATGRADEDQHDELRQLNMLDLYYKHIMPLQPVLRRMSKRGLKKNQKLKVGWSAVLNRKADEFEERLKRGLGDPTLDINSPKQLMDLLYKRMGLPIQYNEDREHGARPTVDADALDNLARIVKTDPRHQHLAPILLLVRSIRTFRKWDSTYVRCEEDTRGFVHGRFSSSKAANGRLNSFDPNMQNFPVDIRVIMEADSEDHVLLARDWGQIEWRVAMTLSGDQAGLDALVAGRDVHMDAYSIAFAKAYDDVTKAERDIAKAVNYGLLYGRGDESIAAGRAGHPEDIIPLDRVQTYRNGFMSKFKGYWQFRNVIQDDVRRKHFVETAWGRRRYWYTRGQMPEAFNHPISGTAAHMMYEALVELENQLPAGATLRLTVHDEVVICSTKDQKTLQQAIDCSREVMERVFPQLTERSLYPDVVRHYYPNGWSCPSDAHIGTNWKMTKGKTKSDQEAEVLLQKQLSVHVR